MLGQVASLAPGSSMAALSGVIGALPEVRSRASSVTTISACAAIPLQPSGVAGEAALWSGAWSGSTQLPEAWGEERVEWLHAIAGGALSPLHVPTLAPSWRRHVEHGCAESPGIVT